MEVAACWGKLASAPPLSSVFTGMLKYLDGLSCQVVNALLLLFSGLGMVHEGSHGFGFLAKGTFH